MIYRDYGISNSKQNKCEEFYLRLHEEIEQSSKSEESEISLTIKRKRAKKIDNVRIYVIFSKDSLNIPYIKIVHEDVNISRRIIYMRILREKLTKKSNKIFSSFISDCTMKLQFYLK